MRQSLADSNSINELNADLFQPEEVDRFGDPKEVRKKAMDFLARREYGQEELVRKLTGSGYVADIVMTEVDRLTDDGLQSDVRFAGSFVQSRINQGKGPVRIREELKERGLGGGDIEQAIEGSEQDWYSLARETRVRKFGDELPGDFPEKAKQMRFLQYRGFDHDQVQAAVSSHGDG
ncbi:MAG: regulatory protein RecX [Woeseiaceae bacterium]